MNELQTILNDDSGSYSTLEYELAEQLQKAERERDEWKDIAMKEQRRSRRIAREALEAGDE